MGNTSEGACASRVVTKGRVGRPKGIVTRLPVDSILNCKTFKPGDAVGDKYVLGTHAAIMLGASYMTFYRWRKAGLIVPPISTNSRDGGYRVRDLQEFARLHMGAK